MFPVVLLPGDPLCRSRANSLLVLAKETEPRFDDAADDALFFASSPTSVTSKGRLETGGDEAQSLDQSMSSHFGYIQSVSTPQELDQLLPQLQAMLMQAGPPGPYAWRSWHGGQRREVSQG